MSENNDILPTLSMVLDQKIPGQYRYFRNHSLLNIIFTGCLSYCSYFLFINNFSALMLLVMQISTALFFMRQFYLVKEFVRCRTMLRIQKKVLKLQEMILNNQVTPEVMEMSLRDLV